MKTNFTIILCALLLSATAVLVGCNDKEKPEESSTVVETGQTEESSTEVETGQTNVETPIEDFYISENEDEVGTITLLYMGSDAHVVYPSEVDGKIVTKITSNMWSHGYTNPNDTTVSVVLPETIKEIDDYTFLNHTALESINLPDSLEVIGTEAFAACTSLKEITIPKNCFIDNIDDNYTYAQFNNSGLEKITISEGVKVIPYSAFENTKIKSIEIPKSVEIVQFWAFSDCKNLTQVVLNEGLKTLGSSTFAGTNISEIIIPSTVTEIDSKVFADCMNLTEIIIPENVETIYENTFEDCKNLEKVTFLGKAPEHYIEVFTAGYVADYTIYFNSDDQGFTTPTWNGYHTQKVGEPSEMKYFEDFGYEFNDDGTIKINNYIGTESNITIPATIEGMDVTTIGIRAFCSTPADIISVSMPDTITTIEEQAFFNSKLKEIKLSANLEVIENRAFNYCKGLESITFPDTLTTLGESAFSYTESLKEISIPGSVKTISYGCFAASGIKTLTLNEGIKTIGENAFSSSKITEVTIPASVTSMHSTAFEWCEDVEIIFVGDVPADYKPEE